MWTLMKIAVVGCGALWLLGMNAIQTPADSTTAPEITAIKKDAIEAAGMIKRGAVIVAKEVSEFRKGEQKQ